MGAVLLLSLALAAGGSQATTGNNNPNAQAPSANGGTHTVTGRPDPDQRVVCRREESVGTRLAARTCMTRAEWRRRERDNRDRARDLVDDSERDNRSDPYYGPQPL